MDIKRLRWGGEDQGPVRVDRAPDPELPYRTILIHANSFDGRVIIEGSLASNPSEDDWFIFREEVFVKPDLFANKVQNRVINTQNSILWMRTSVVHNVPVGVVDRITLM